MVRGVNQWLDWVVRPEIRLLGRCWSAFRLIGGSGLALALALALVLAGARGLSLGFVIVATLAALATSLALALATKVLTGQERLVFYRQHVAALVAVALVGTMLGQTVLAVLDIAVLAIGVSLAVGRFGCLMVGCCYGRPQRWGVRYRSEHATAGLPGCLVGARLAPVQLVEAVWAGGGVAIGSLLVLTGQPDGSALAWFGVTQAVGRYGLEFWRGDDARLEWWGFSEAQWTALAWLVAVVGAELAGLLPGQAWHLGLTLGVLLSMWGIAWRRRRGEQHRLMRPHHVMEVAAALDWLMGHPAPAESGAAAIPVVTTSLGLHLSHGTVGSDGDRVDHYAFSCADRPLSPAATVAVGQLILALRHPDAACRLVQGNRGAMHLLIGHDLADGASAPASVGFIG